MHTSGSKQAPATRLHTFAALLVVALAGFAAAKPLRHDDLFFHLRTGRLIFESGAVPTREPFSHTMPGAPWTSHEWGFALLVDSVYQLLGLHGLVALGSALVAACFALVLVAIRRTVFAERAWIVTPLLLLAVLAAARPMFLVRAALLSSLALAALQILLHAQHGRPRDLRIHAAIALLFLLWANTHVGVLFGLCVLAGSAAQGAVDTLRQAPETGWLAAARQRLLPRVLLLLACTALTFCNPNGLHLWTFAFELNDLYYNSGVSWSMGMFGPPTLARHPFFFLLLACCLLAMLPPRRLIAVLRDGRQPAVMQLLCTALFAVLALRSMRFVPDFSLFAAVFCAMLWAGPAPSAASAGAVSRSAFWNRPLARELVLIVAGAWMLAPSWPVDPLPATAPTRLASFLEQNHVSGTLFNMENWGGYLGFRLRTRVYWDGRNDVFAPLAKELAATEDFGTLVARYRLDMLALHRNYVERFGPYLQTHGSEWACVFFDQISALYLRRTDRFAQVIARYEYRMLRPFAVPSEGAVAGAARVPGARARLEHELDQLHAQAGPSEQEHYVRGLLGQATAAHPFGSAPSADATR